MNYLKKLIKSFTYLLSIILILNLVLTLLNYIGIIKGNGITIFEIITLIISFFISGFVFGKNSNKKGYIEGMKISGIYILLMIMIGLIYKIKLFEIKNLVFYIIIIMITTFGSILGINKRKLI